MFLHFNSDSVCWHRFFLSPLFPMYYRSLWFAVYLFIFSFFLLLPFFRNFKNEWKEILEHIKLTITKHRIVMATHEIEKKAEKMHAKWKLQKRKNHFLWKPTKHKQLQSEKEVFFIQRCHKLNILEQYLTRFACKNSGINWLYVPITDLNFSYFNAIRSFCFALFHFSQSSLWHSCKNVYPQFGFILGNKFFFGFSIEFDVIVRYQIENARCMKWFLVFVRSFLFHLLLKHFMYGCCLSQMCFAQWAFSSDTVTVGTAQILYYIQ